MTKPHFSEVPIYEIRIKTHLQGCLQEWFEGMNITDLGKGEAILSGPIVDQSALHGLLAKARQHHLVLISIKKIDPS